MKVWDLNSGQELRTLSGHRNWVTALAVTADGRVVSGSDPDGTVKVWDLNSGRELRTLEGHGGRVMALALTGDGRVVSGSDDGTVKVWDLDSGQEQRTLSGHGDGVNALALTGTVESSPAHRRWHGEGVGPGQRAGAAHAVGTWPCGRRWR